MASSSAGARSPRQRKADALAHFSAEHADGWVATASSDGRAHLVPLSIVWDGECILVCIERTSRTARNVEASGEARIGVGGTRDVVMVDTTLDLVVDVGGADATIADTYARQADWDPRVEPEGHVYVRLRPRRIQVWREADEIAGRTIMRAGTWTVA